MTQPSVMSTKALGWTTNAFVKINNVIKGFGIIGGGLAASLADWITGSIALSVLFSGTDGLPVPPIVIGSIWSLGAWGVQLLLWEMILSGKLKNAWSGWGNKVAIGAVGILKLCDDVIDLLAIFYMTQNNVLRGLLPGNSYGGIMFTVYLLSWILVGFSEVFVSISINMLKSNNQHDTRQNTQQNQNRFPRDRRSIHSPTRTFPLNEETMSRLPKSTRSE